MPRDTAMTATGYPLRCATNHADMSCYLTLC